MSVLNIHNFQPRCKEITMNEQKKRHRIRVPLAPGKSLFTSLMCRESVSSILKDGESCAAAKPSLVTLENSSLPPTGGLDDITGALPKARDGIIHRD